MDNYQQLNLLRQEVDEIVKKYNVTCKILLSEINIFRIVYCKRCYNTFDVHSINTLNSNISVCREETEFNTLEKLQRFNYDDGNEIVDPENNITRFMDMCINGNINMIKRYMSRDDFNWNAINRYNQSHFMYACKYINNMGVIMKFMDRPDFDVNAKNHCEMTHFMDVCQYFKNKELAIRIFERPDFDANAINYDNETNLMFASEYFNLKN